LTRRLRLWIPAAMTALEVSWITLAWPFVSRHYDIFSPDPTAHPEAYDFHPGLRGLELVRYSSWVLTALVLVVALAGAIRRFRDGHMDVAPAAFAVAPLLVLATQSYEKEGPLRAVLFALP